MKRLSSWAVRRPILFSVSFCVPVILAFVTLATVIAEVLKHLAGWGSNGAYVGHAIGLVIGSVFLHELLRRFEWLDVVRLRKLQPVAWLFIVPPLLYVITAVFYVSSGTFDLNFSDPLRSSLITIRMLSTGLFEETAFRGVILSAMLLAWGSTKRGVLKCFLISSLLFGMLHLVNLLSRDILPAFSNAVYTCFTGALFAGVALRCRSIWPAVLLHGLSNALLSLNRLGDVLVHPASQRYQHQPEYIHLRFSQSPTEETQLEIPSPKNPQPIEAQQFMRQSNFWTLRCRRYRFGACR
jgi:membrane protease YdiL (CAAX protease family)